MGEKILDVFAREFRAHPAEEYERCIRTGTLTVNYEKVPIDYRLKHNDLLANIVHRYVVTGVEIELYTNCQNKRYRKNNTRTHILHIRTTHNNNNIL